MNSYKMIFLQCKAEFKGKHFKNVNVKGRLSKHADFWKNVLNVSDTDSNIIFSGYIVPFFQFPDSKFCNNNQSAICHSEFVSSSIEELLKNGVILQVNDVPHVVDPLTVSVNAKGKERLILDLRHVNQYVVLYKFKLEGIKEALDFVQKDGFKFKLTCLLDIIILIYILQCSNISDFHGQENFMYLLLCHLVYLRLHLFLQKYLEIW